MSFEILCMTMIGLLFGAALIFGGYRLFFVLLPIWGFFFGLGLGAQTIQVIFGDAFLATITSWVVGFLVGIVFAVLSYFFYIVAVALLAGSFGYGLAVGLLTWIGLNYGFLVWAIGIVAGIALAVVVLVFNIQKYAIIAITAFGGTAAVIFVLLATVGGYTPVQLAANPVALGYI
ncbi:MAG: TMEM198/TM7SF3 family protein [Chloroflexi bacterium]|nr:TMEM198/TM7SF3 family protein [Chloroflexota bacterium]